MAHTDRPQGDGPPEAGSAEGFECDACGKHFPGEPASSGYVLSTRGEEVRFEEPPLCEQCAQALLIGGMRAEEFDG